MDKDSIDVAGVGLKILLGKLSNTIIKIKEVVIK